ncbi:response regulator transcription factor [Corynebacterium freiburgense]|uniref:response regulator transcription factor n=1 Tax=Corynebacterium freiburgense TaxID=556548 RepID=UPI00040FD132|nr:response regulator transcription factor [Corynebacterium freiburgense]WJZ01877.1 putative transcriptional regulatory protein NarL [Corynebacterium freiburgense]
MHSEPVAKLRVLIADNDPLAISTVKRYLSRDTEMQIVGEAENGLQALDMLQQFDIDIVIAALRMPHMDGITLLQNMRLSQIPTPFVALTTLDDDTTMLKVLQAGGAGYILKSASPKELVTAIQTVANGGIAISPKLLNRLVEHIYQSEIEPAESCPVTSIFMALNETEKRVLENLCCGKSNAEIARTLQYSEATVKKYISSLIARFHANSRLHLAILVVESGALVRHKHCLEFT